MRAAFPETMDDSEKSRAEELHDWVSSQPEISDVLDDMMFGQPAPGWYSRLLSELVLLTDNDTIEACFVSYVEDSASEEHDAHRATVCVIGGRRIIEAETFTHRPKDQSRTVVTSRSDIRSVSVREPYGVLGNSASRWPGPIIVELTLRGRDEPLVLFADRNNGAARALDMRALLRSLLENVST